MTQMIRIDTTFYQQLRLAAFRKNTSIQGELDAILSQHFLTSTTQGK